CHLTAALRLLPLARSPLALSFFFSLFRPPPRSPLFPYTTLFRSGQIPVTGVLVDRGDHVGREVDDLLEVLRGHVQQVSQTGGNTLEVPDVGHGSGQFDVAHALTAHLGPGDLDAAAFADDALEADALVLAARALPVAGGSEDLLAEESVLLRLQGPVVDGLRLFLLTVRPAADVLSGG